MRIKHAQCIQTYCRGGETKEHQPQQLWGCIKSKNNNINQINTHGGGVVIGRVWRIPVGPLTFQSCRADYCGITILRL